MKNLATIRNRLTRKPPPNTASPTSAPNTSSSSSPTIPSSLISQLYHIPEHLQHTSSPIETTPLDASDISTLSDIPYTVKTPTDTATDIAINAAPEPTDQSQKIAAIAIDTSDQKLSPLANLRQLTSKLTSRKNATTGERPIRVLIGYLSEVAEKDALEYAMGVCEKFFDQLSITFYDVFKYEQGYIYEIHEGGVGLAYTPLILQQFRNLGTYDPSTAQANPFIIPTGTRHVEVVRTRNGVSAVLLPESFTLPTADYQQPTSTHHLSPAFNQRTGVLFVTAAFFVVSFFAMVTTSLVQYQSYDDPPPLVSEKLSYQNLPSAQWPKISALSENGRRIKAVRFKNNQWQPIEYD